MKKSIYTKKQLLKNNVCAGLTPCMSTYWHARVKLDHYDVNKSTQFYIYSAFAMYLKHKLGYT